MQRKRQVEKEVVVMLGAVIWKQNERLARFTLADKPLPIPPDTERPEASQRRLRQESLESSAHTSPRITQ
jgi:hypothetical protein